MRYARIPEQTVRRLPVYLRALLSWTDLGREYISSEDLARCVGVHSWQVRKDFSYFGEFGTPGVGYPVSRLSGQIKRILRLSGSKRAALIGVGNLGRAILAYGGFSRYGLEIAAAFDCDPAKVGQRIQGIEIEDMANVAVLQDRKISLAVLAVPVGVAQEVVDSLVAAGIKGFLSFAACHVAVPRKVKVISIDIAMDLASLPYYLPSD